MNIAPRPNPCDARRCFLRTVAWLAPGTVFGASATAAPAGPRRLALVIGNSQYQRAPLRFAGSDAELMTATLRDLRFEVHQHLNLGRRAFLDALDGFVEKVAAERGGAAALVYYAGHGVQVDGLNYLIPVDRDIDNMAGVRDFAIPAARLVRQLGEANADGVNIVVLDACRNNPFHQRRGARAPSGLAPLASPRGVLVAYATDPGQPALDGGGPSGRHSIYTESLARAMRQPGLPVETVFKQVRNAVSDATQGRQTPWENTSLRGDFYFVPR